MIIITKKKEFHIDAETAVAIGKFDGVHKGHKVLLDQILANRVKGLKTVVFTFDPPFEEFFGKGEYKYILTQNEKRRIFEEMGIDYLVEFPMDKETIGIEPEEFVRRYLKEYLNAKLIVCGDDLSFGKGGRGDFALLKSLASKYAFEAKSINKIKENNQIISSSLIREKILSGDITYANLLLGYSFFITGSVIHGKALGRTMGVPTVNLSFDSKKIIPPFGVYYSSVVINGKEYKSITNIGTKPTVKSDLSVNSETFIYDFDENIYDCEITVKLLKFKRKEEKFGSFDELSQVIHKDLEDGRIFKESL